VSDRERDLSTDVQALMDGELRSHFAAVPPPSLPPSFADRCARRAAARPSALPLDPRRRFALRAYWCLAALVSAVVLVRIDWPAGAPTGLTMTFGAIALLVALPVLLLARLRGGLFPFVLRLLG
jgi:hypothetical protein